MRKLKKFLFLMFACFFMLNLNIFANSSNLTNNGMHEIPLVFNQSDVMPFGVTKPTDDWNLISKGQYDFQGKSYSQNLYSNYRLTGATKVEIYVKNNSTFNLTVKLLKSQTGVDWSQSTKKIDANEDQTWSVSKLDSSAKYVLKFSGPSEFFGNIKAEK